MQLCGAIRPAHVARDIAYVHRFVRICLLTQLFENVRLVEVGIWDGRCTLMGVLAEHGRSLITLLLRG